MFFLIISTYKGHFLHYFEHLNKDLMKVENLFKIKLNLA